MHSTILKSLVVMLLLPGLALAADKIRQEDYIYDMEIARDAHLSDPFVICSKCGPDKLTVEPAPLQVAMKFSDVQPLGDEPAETKVEEVVVQETPVKKGPTLIGSIYFDFDSAKIRKSEFKTLGGVGQGKYSLSGYTCIIGTDKYNLGLSKRRAESVATFIKKTGAQIAEAKGLGKSSDQKEKKLNRRVDIYLNESEKPSGEEKKHEDAH